MLRRLAETGPEEAWHHVFDLVWHLEEDVEIARGRVRQCRRRSQRTEEDADLWSESTLTDDIVG